MSSSRAQQFFGKAMAAVMFIEIYSKRHTAGAYLTEDRPPNWTMTKETKNSKPC